MRMETAKTTPQPRWRLAEARTLRKLSQQEVADRIGTTYVNISRWERGITRPGPYFRRKLCSLFGKTEQELDLGSNAGSVPARSAPGRGEVDRVPARDASPQGEAVYDPAIPLQPAIRLV